MLAQKHVLNNNIGNAYKYAVNSNAVNQKRSNIT